MQPMPKRNRSVTVLGIALLAVIVGGIAFWSSRRETTPTPGAVDEFSVGQEKSAAEATPPVAASAEQPAAGTAASDSEAAASVAAGAASRVPATHTVAPGDTLSSISRKYYGTHIYAGDIEALNKLEHPNSLLVGSKLTLPRPEALHTAGR